MSGTAKYPNGYVRFYTEGGQPLDLKGKPGDRQLRPARRLVGMNLALHTHRVDRVSFDYALVLHTDQGAELRVETPGTITEPDGTPTSFDPADPGDSARMLLRLLHATISGAEQTDGGTLLVTLDNGLELDVPPHDEYEAWALSFTDGRKVVCMPGGESATWGPA